MTGMSLPNYTSTCLQCMWWLSDVTGMLIRNPIQIPFGFSKCVDSVSGVTGMLLRNPTQIPCGFSKCTVVWQGYRYSNSESPLCLPCMCWSTECVMWQGLRYTSESVCLQCLSESVMNVTSQPVSNMYLQCMCWLSMMWKRENSNNNINNMDHFYNSRCRYGPARESMCMRCIHCLLCSQTAEKYTSRPAP